MKFSEYSEFEGLNEFNDYYLLILTKYSTDLKKNTKQYLVWSKKDLQTYEPKAYGSNMDAAIATFNKVREDREEEEYIDCLGKIDVNKSYASKVATSANIAKADIMKICPEAKKALDVKLDESKDSKLTEGEFISVKDWEAKFQKVNPAKEKKLADALKIVKAKESEVEKFMKTYDSKDATQRTKRAQLGAELANAMGEYLKLV